MVSWPGMIGEPPGRVVARGAQHPASDRDDHAVVLGDRDELVRHDRAELGMFPTEECLESDDVVGFELDDRLVDELELVSLEGVGELVLELEALDGGGSHGRFVDDPTRLAGRLGLVHRNVRVAQQRGGGRLGVGVGDADAGRHGDVVVAERHRGREALQHALGDCFGFDRPA